MACLFDVGPHGEDESGIVVAFLKLCVIEIPVADFSAEDSASNRNSDQVSNKRQRIRGPVEEIDLPVSDYFLAVHDVRSQRCNHPALRGPIVSLSGGQPKLRRLARERWPVQSLPGPLTACRSALLRGYARLRRTRLFCCGSAAGRARRPDARVRPTPGEVRRQAANKCQARPACGRY